MPAPESRTRTTIHPPSSLAVSSIRPPSGVNLTALWRRFETTCARRVGSASTHKGRSGSFTSSCCRRAAASGRELSRLAASTSPRVIRRRSIFTVPRVIRAMSSRSSTMRVRCRVWRRMTSRHRSLSTAESAPSSRSTAWRIGASGFRSSWPSMARNSFLRRSLWTSCSARRWALSSAWRRCADTAPRTRPVVALTAMNTCSSTRPRSGPAPAKGPSPACVARLATA